MIDYSFGDDHALHFFWLYRVVLRNTGMVNSNWKDSVIKPISLWPWSYRSLYTYGDYVCIYIQYLDLYFPIQEKKQKREELNRLRNLKRQELEEKLKSIQEKSGAESMPFTGEELDEDFDPEEHDKKMNVCTYTFIILLWSNKNIIMIQQLICNLS